MDSNLLVDTSDLGFALRGFLGSPLEISHSKAYKVGWRTLSSVLEWIFYIRRVVARRKKGKEIVLNYRRMFFSVLLYLQLSPK
jgi:hypothetical protein